MTESVPLGEITCPSGELVLMDGGYLGLWSGDGAPDTASAVDFEIVGADAEAAARSFDRQPGRMLYDIPGSGAAQFISDFDEHCRQSTHRASLRALPEQLPHRERVRRAIADGGSEFFITGAPVIAVGGIPTDRPLRVTGTRHSAWEWENLRIQMSDESVETVHELGEIIVDWARFAFADADALSHWRHDEPVDGLADVVFWGLHEAEIAAEFGASRTDTPGDEVYGWLNLPIREAYRRAVALRDRKEAEPERRFAFDFRPHSHHWQVMAGVRASAHEAATITVGGASILFAMTSIGDGNFPAQLELDAAGAPVAIQVTVQGDEE